MKAFVPASDEQIFEASQDQPVPYRVGMPCIHWYAVIDKQDELIRVRSPDDRPDSHPVLTRSRR